MSIFYTTDRDMSPESALIAIEVSSDDEGWQIDYWWRPEVADKARADENFDTIIWNNPFKLKGYIEEMIEYIQTGYNCDVCVINSVVAAKPHDIQVIKALKSFDEGE